jgi:pyruvate dehydrogenase E1 component
MKLMQDPIPDCDPFAEPQPFESLEDGDPEETQEWKAAIESVVQHVGPKRAAFLIKQVTEHALQLGVSGPAQPHSAYLNTIPLALQAAHPGDVSLEERLTAITRWNALAMVMRANRAYGDLGGHVASYASAAEIFEVGFNHFFRGANDESRGDLVFFQAHSAPGVYARAYLEGRLPEDRLANYRQEIGGGGLCSYPHPWLMPDFWQFPTGSMGLGPLMSIQQARFMRYLQHRGLIAPSARHVWGVFGDGEMDEPESISALTLAAREKLDNLTFIVNCNLQRLDGPVRGNGQIVQELEALFTGAGWNVIKVLWGSDWDPLFARDRHGALLKQFAHTVDGQYQTLGANDGEYNQSHFFALDPDLRGLVAHMSYQEIDALKRGGHDFRKLYAAFSAARAHPNRPTVILAKTKKGYGMGRAGESRMTAHQEKKLDVPALQAFRDRFNLPLSDEDLVQMRFLKPANDSEEMRYLKERRVMLGGYLPVRMSAAPAVAVPPIGAYATFALAAEQKEMSTTMAFVRMLTALLRDKTLGPRVVPIVADEARTFGMASLFRQIGIYSPSGQLYEPEDSSSLLAYRESRQGQLMEEGISEAGALSTWISAATSYSVHGIAMLPFYIYYSMFGFQRVGDLIWAAADQRARGFLIGATAGRTTLGGEGLQHQDGTSHLIAATIPNCRAFDPAFAFELAVIVDHGMRRMLEEQVDEFYYVTAMNENYAQPSMPLGVAADIIKGLYRFQAATGDVQVRLVGSGAILCEVIEAAGLLQTDFGVAAEVFSATSFSELARNAREIERLNRLHPEAPRLQSHLELSLSGDVPIIAASDYVRAYAQMIVPYLSARSMVLGTDGFGRSDSRTALRRFFEVDRYQIVAAALFSLAELGSLDRSVVAHAIERYRINADAEAPWLL